MNHILAVCDAEEAYALLMEKRKKEQQEKEKREQKQNVYIVFIYTNQNFYIFILYINQKMIQFSIITYHIKPLLKVSAEAKFYSEI